MSNQVPYLYFVRVFSRTNCANYSRQILLTEDYQTEEVAAATSYYTRFGRMRTRVLTLKNIHGALLFSRPKNNAMRLTAWPLLPSRRSSDLAL